jgi:hypothetical protein
MAIAQRNLHTAGHVEDAAQVVHVLHHVGPVPLQELADEPELAGWPPERVEQAIVSAWSHALIFIDNRDLLIAL